MTRNDNCGLCKFFVPYSKWSEYDEDDGEFGTCKFQNRQASRFEEPCNSFSNIMEDRADNGKARLYL